LAPARIADKNVSSEVKAVVTKIGNSAKRRRTAAITSMPEMSGNPMSMRARSKWQSGLVRTCKESLDFPDPCHQFKDPHKRVLEHQIVFNQQNV
jgi:hypothetical protein